jgi:hypothetical protein
MCNLIAKVPRSNSNTKYGNNGGSEVTVLAKSQDVSLNSVCRTIYYKQKSKKKVASRQLGF